MLNIAICNDHVPELRQLTKFVTEYIRQNPNLPLRVLGFQSLFDLIESIQRGEDFSICLLDHHGGESWMEGRSAEASLRKKAPKAAIIGFTGDARSAFLSPSPGDTLKLEARMAKPVSVVDLYGVLDRLIQRRLPQIARPALELPTRQGSRSLPLERLTRAHYRDHVVRCYMEDGETIKSSVLRVPFNQLIQPLLQTGGFSWLSASCVVNLAFVEELDRKNSTARMADGEVLTVPKAAFPGLQKSFENYKRK